MLTESEHEEVLCAIGYVKSSAECGQWFHELHGFSWRPDLDSPLVRAQMTDWLLERDDIAFLGGGPGRFSVRLVDSDVHIEPTIAEALARCVLEVSRADD